MQQRASAPIKVLLVDDHGIVRDGLTALLDRHEQIQVIGAVGNGKEAVRAAVRLKPHVIVMDLVLPQLSGADATARILETLPETRIVIMSACDTSEHVFRALRAGAQGYVLKEGAAAEIIDAVMTVFHGERYLSPKITRVLIDALLSEPSLHSPLESLSAREREVMNLTVSGATSAQIAMQLSLSRKTVDTYRSRAMDKLGVQDLAGLIRFAAVHATTPM